MQATEGVLQDEEGEVQAKEGVLQGKEGVLQAREDGLQDEEGVMLIRVCSWLKEGVLQDEV